MGVSLLLLLSAWNEILMQKFYGLIDTIWRVTVRTLSYGEMVLRTSSFKKHDSETINKFDGSETMMEENSSSFSNCDSAKSSRLCKDSDVKLHITKPRISVPEPVFFFSPRPVNELDAAATKVQKVYKSYRTRRNLADCAVLVEELWWKTLDSAALKRCSISFFNLEKHETAVSRWSRAKTRAAKVGKGLSKDEKAQKLAHKHWLEAIDPRHRYGHNLSFYHDNWSKSKSTQPFFYWLDIGDGKEVNIGKCPRSNLQRDCIKYLGPREREEYEVTVENGKLLYCQTRVPINTIGESKWIFVLSTSRNLYVGKKQKGVFQHSSFLSGGTTTAAGTLFARNGVLEAIWRHSGHYHPTEDHLKEFISFLEEHKVDLTNIKIYSVDDDNASYDIAGDEHTRENAKVLHTNEVSVDSNERIGNANNHQQGSNGASAEAPVFDMAKRLSCKWTSGVGPRIGCVRDYPVELQSQALEHVNLTPRVTPGRVPICGPIPSPRPSPTIRVSPRLAYMGCPSPRV